jgi:hypothetical protein
MIVWDVQVNVVDSGSPESQDWADGWLYTDSLSPLTHSSRLSLSRAGDVRDRRERVAPLFEASLLDIERLTAEQALPSS